MDEDGLVIETEVPKELVSKFLSASSFLPNVVNRLDKGSALSFYGLYKQATIGSADEADRPSWYDVAARSKFNAWCAKSHLSKEQAMIEYCKLLKGLFPEWVPSTASSSQGWGIRPSRMVIDPEVLGELGTSYKSPRMETSMEKEWFKAMREDDVEEIEALLNKNSDLLEATDQHLGMTALARAVDLGCERTAEFLIFKGANVNVEDVEGSTPLHFAAQCNRVRLARLLLQYGADLEARDADGMAPYQRCDDKNLAQELKPNISHSNISIE